MADFSQGTEDDGMPGLLVNVSVIILHLLHDRVMDGIAGAMAPPSSMAVCIVLRSFGLLSVTILDVVVPAVCRDIFSGSRDTLSKDHSWKRNALGP